MNNGMVRKDRDNFPTFLNRFLGNDFFANFNDGDMPAVNVTENKNDYTLEVSAPGFNKNDLSLNVDRNILTISGKHEKDEVEKDDKGKVLRQEFRSSSFSRSFTLPENVDTEAIAAEHDNGVLKLVMPKKDMAKEDAVKTIEIK